MPATNGPTTIPAVSENADTALAAVSSSGPFETLGRSADCVGRVNLRLAVTAMASTSVRPSGALTDSATATEPSASDGTR